MSSLVRVMSPGRLPAAGHLVAGAEASNAPQATPVAVGVQAGVALPRTCVIQLRVALTRPLVEVALNP